MEMQNKGKSVIDFPNDYTLIDLETTGFSPRYDSIIEIGAIKVRDNAIIDKYSCLINPKIEIDEHISSLTGITNDMLKNQPAIENKIKEFIDFIGSDIVVAQNANFDINFTYTNLLNIENIYFENDFIDILRISRKLLPDLEHHRNIDMMNYFNVLGTNHRALGDCEIEFIIFNKLKELALTIYSSVDDFKRAFKKKHSYGTKIDITKLLAESSEIDETNPLYGKVCVFTGALEKFTRVDAAQLVVNVGGIVGKGVTKATNFLILGNNDYCSSIKDGKSSKQKKAEMLIENGADLMIIPEDVFCDMLNQ